MPLTREWIAGFPDRVRKMTRGRAATTEGALRVAFEEIEALKKRLDLFGMQTLADIPDGAEIDPHWRGKIEP